MKLKKFKKILLIVSALSVILAAIPGFSVSAGKITKQSSIVNADGEINANEWYDPNDELVIKKNVLTIPKDSTEETRLISKTIAQSESSINDMLKVDFNIRFNQIAQGKKFILGFGLSSVEAYSAEPGNLEIEFTNKGGVFAGLTYYDEDGNAKVLSSAKRCGSIGSNLKVSAVVSTKKKLTLKVNNSTVFSVSLPTSAEGRVGFLQTGDCGAEISNCMAEFQNYERPENTDFLEDFESGTYNDSLFTMRFGGSSRSPAYMAVENYKGSKVLMFRNTALCYFGTKQQYSNFEMTFDIPYFSRSTVKDKNGNITIAPNNVFAVSFGDNAVDFSGYGFTSSTSLVHFTPSTVWDYNYTPDKFRVNYGEMGFSDNNTDEGFSVKMVMIDGNFTLSLKSLKDTKYTEIAKAYYENMRTGYIKLWSTGDCNVGIDNWKIKNLDTKPNSVKTEFKSALFEVKDFDYKPAETKFNPDRLKETTEVKEEKSFNWMMIVLYTAVGAVVIFGGCGAVAIIKKKKAKKRGSDI